MDDTPTFGLPAFQRALKRVLKGALVEYGPEHGCPETELAAAETRLGFALPASLRAVYALVAKHPVLTTVHNRLVPTSKLELTDDLLVFQRENQNVCSHAIHVRDIAAPDPAVKQRSKSGEHVYDYQDRFSAFILQSICWEALMHHARDSGPFRCKADTPTLERMCAELKAATYLPTTKDDVVALYGGGVVVCAFRARDEDAVNFYVGSPKDRAIDRFISRFGPFDNAKRWYSARV